MTDSVFDIALEKRFTDSSEITTIDVTSSDMLLIRDSTTGVVMRISFATLVTAISSAISSSFASLVDGKVPASQLPSYVDDVLEYTNFAAFPATGESGKIYAALDTNKIYRWSGSAYVEISASLAIGETSSTAYRGDRGKTAFDHSQITTGNPHGTTKADVGLSNVDNTSDSNKTVLNSQNATNIAVSNDETSDSWLFPVLVTANDGNLPSKVSASKLSFNPTKGLNVSGTTVSKNFQGTGDSTINTVTYNSGFGGALCLIRGYDGNTGNSYARLYLVYIQIAGGAGGVGAALVSSSGSGSASFSFSTSGSNVTITSSSTDGGNFWCSFIGL